MYQCLYKKKGAVQRRARYPRTRYSEDRVEPNHRLLQRIAATPSSGPSRISLYHPLPLMAPQHYHHRPKPSKISCETTTTSSA